MILGIYVDDIIVMHNDDAMFDKFKAQFCKRFIANHLGKLNWFLGIGVDQTSDGVYLSQTKYIEEITNRFAPNAHAVNVMRDVPCTEHGLAKLSLAKDAMERERASKLPYLALIGSLLYVSTMTRPDVSFALSQLCQYMHDPSPECYEIAQTVLLYLYKTRDLRLAFKKRYVVPECMQKHSAKIDANHGLYAFSDSSWGVARPVYGYAVFFGSGLISYTARKLKSAESSCEAEYAATSHAAKELAFVRNVMDELGFPLSAPIILGVDNTAAIDVANDHGTSQRTKHFDRLTHYIREAIEHLYVLLTFVRTADQRADIFTKCLDKTTFLRIRNMLFAA